MPNYTCPSCRQVFHASTDPDAPCVICGAKLSEFTASNRSHTGPYDLVYVARSQRLMLILAPLGFAGQVLMGMGPAIVLFGMWLSLLYLLPTVALVIAAMMLSDSLNTPSEKVMLAGIGMFVPVINILILIGLNSEATRVLQKAGLRVGVLGVARNEAEHAMDPTRCRECGYNLTGNVSGRCPECGASFDR